MNKVEAYWQSYATKNGLNLSTPDAWMFGDGSKEMGDTLGALVVDGIKTGTCAAHCIYELEGEKLQQVGQFDIILDGDENPLAIIQYTNIELVKMKNVTPAFAKSEGEGDLSYDYWYDAHVQFFIWELGLYDLTFTPDIVLVCQTFEVVDIY